MKKEVVVLVLFTLFSCSGQSDYSLMNRSWDACAKTGLSVNSDDKCTYFVTYTFNTDGSFNESVNTNQHYVDVQNSTWEYENDELIITTKEKGEITSILKYEIKWVDNSTFYIENGNASGVKVYTICSAVD